MWLKFIVQSFMPVILDLVIQVLDNLAKKTESKVDDALVEKRRLLKKSISFCNAVMRGAVFRHPLNYFVMLFHVPNGFFVSAVSALLACCVSSTTYNS